MAVIRGPVRLVLHLPTNPHATAADLDQAIRLVPSLQPGRELFGRDVRTWQWAHAGTITRVWRDDTEICQEAAIDAGVAVAELAPVYTRIEVLPERAHL
jgi:hypothetical protein